LALASLALTLCGVVAIPGIFALPCVGLPLALALFAAPVVGLVGLCFDRKKWHSALALLAWAIVFFPIAWSVTSTIHALTTRPRSLGLNVVQYVKLMTDSTDIASDPLTYRNTDGGDVANSAPLDPWGRPYIITLKSDGSLASIMTSGRDMTPGTADDIDLMKID